jgi:alkylation response protein AidB-like acyl-CoA dehydrogenase
VHVTAEIVAEQEKVWRDLRSVTSGGSRFGPLMRQLFNKIGERGWLGIAYPGEYGGQGGDWLTQNIVEGGFMRAGVNIGLNRSGTPAIMAAGTEEQSGISFRG